MDTLLFANITDLVRRAITVFALYKEPLIRLSSWIKIVMGGIFLSDESSSHQGGKVLQNIKNLFVQYAGITAGFPVEKKVSVTKILSPVVIIVFLTLAGCGAGEEVVAAGNRAYTPPNYGTVTLVWEEPTTLENGDPLTNIENYKIYYGKSTGNYTDSIDVGTNEFGYPSCVDIGGGVSECTYTIQQIPVGTYYFAVTVYDLSGLESLYSNEENAPVS